ncbi:hypothetical protein QF035_000443 [Streptomyces umbrinus]|uniref:Secreted protein n=1 Tax=Streptomyces umbrinus TaxID=67370 RepID=A0ABU0SH32_9ACTN|nr:hypothetical protein [Streptomyces umbrinus]
MILRTGLVPALLRLTLAGTLPAGPAVAERAILKPSGHQLDRLAPSVRHQPAQTAIALGPLAVPRNEGDLTESHWLLKLSS